jgi:hypothetical protein
LDGYLDGREGREGCEEGEEMEVIESEGETAQRVFQQQEQERQGPQQALTQQR